MARRRVSGDETVNQTVDIRGRATLESAQVRKTPEAS